MSDPDTLSTFKRVRFFRIDWVGLVRNLYDASFGRGQHPMTLDWTEGSLAEGLRWYDAGEFFAAHEAWESRWLES